MSLILEALRKSEAERRRGLPPDVHAELPPPPRPRGRAMPAWAWIALGVACVALAAWLLLKPRTATMPAGAPQPDVADVQPPPAAPSPRIAAPPPADATLPRLTPVPIAPPVEETPPDVAEGGIAEPQPASEAVAPSPPVAQPPAPRPAPVANAEPGRVMTLGDLDAGARDALPPLRMSMHLWNENPAQRFAIIDGRRITEGDAIGDVRVVRIERDGVLLEWQGRGIRLPVR